MAEPDRGQPYLKVEDLHGWYGESHILQGISFHVEAGEIVTLLGRNGAGKTTTLRGIMGLLPRCQGSVTLLGKEIGNLRPFEVARAGISYCPEERAILASLTVEENLRLPPAFSPGGMTREQIEKLFPNLVSRRKAYGNQLSGGEQQMLAIARILRSGNRVFLLDEPTEGLAPVIVQQIAATVQTLKATGYTVLLVEQNFRFAEKLADRHYVLEHGAIIDAMPGQLSDTERARLRGYLGV